MKHLLPWIIALAALPGSALQAQNITGTWQGTLKTGPRDLRIVMKISLEDDKLKAIMYSIDQGGQPMPASSITRDGSGIKIVVTPINGAFEGRISSDANSIAGTWTQAMPLPLSLIRATPETAWSIPEPLPPPKIMDATANPSFEVSTIKPSKPDARFSLLVNRSGMLNSTNSSLSDLIKFAYDLHLKQIIGGPKWIESEKYDVSAKPDTEGIPNVSQLKVMMQKLLAERFQLTFHRDKKEMSVYAITMTKGGHKLTKNEGKGNLPGFSGGGPRGMVVRNATIAEWATVLQANSLDQPVVDQTGLGTQRWDFILKWTPDGSQNSFGGAPPNSQPAAPGDAAPPPDIYAAFQQQLGLKLESTKAPAEVLVIDRVEKPSEN